MSAVHQPPNNKQRECEILPAPSKLRQPCCGPKYLIQERQAHFVDAVVHRPAQFVPSLNGQQWATPDRTHQLERSCCRDSSGCRLHGVRDVNAPQRRSVRGDDREQCVQCLVVLLLSSQHAKSTSRTIIGQTKQMSKNVPYLRERVVGAVTQADDPQLEGRKNVAGWLSARRQLLLALLR